MLGLCDPSNLLFEYSFYPLRSDVLFSNYFEDLFIRLFERCGRHNPLCKSRPLFRSVPVPQEQALNRANRRDGDGVRQGGWGKGRKGGWRRGREGSAKELKEGRAGDVGKGEHVSAIASLHLVFDLLWR